MADPDKQLKSALRERGWNIDLDLCWRRSKDMPGVQFTLKEAENLEFGEEVHGWFGLTYANYLVLNRSLLQSMPGEWQHRFVTCLEELRDSFSHLDHPDGYMVAPRGDNGKFIKDTIPHYNRGRTKVERR